MNENTDELVHMYNKCVTNQVIIKLTEVCEGEGWNTVEILEKYNLLDQPITRDYKPKKTRNITTPLPKDRCNALNSSAEQCKRSKKDGCDYCRRHKHKRTYGTIHDKPTVVSKENTIKIEENNENELEIEHKGNLITLENGTEVIFIPTTGLCYSKGGSCMRPELLGSLSSDNKTII